MEPHFCNLTPTEQILSKPFSAVTQENRRCDTSILVDPQLYAMNGQGRKVLTGNMYTFKHYASPSDKTGPKNETSHLALKPWQVAPSQKPVT